VIPGEIIPSSGEVRMAPRDDVVELEVSNRSDRAIQVTSHFHFFEVNKALKFDREAAFGRRLDVPPGLAVRFAPGETHTVRLRLYGGKQVVRGFQGLVDGAVADPGVRAHAVERARARGFIG
jgi:urease beta subunit